MSNTVSDEVIHKFFGLMFHAEGNNPVESIEVIGANKIVHIQNDIYNASIQSPDDFYKFFEGHEFITVGLYEDDGDWVVGEPEDFQISFRVWLSS